MLQCARPTLCLLHTKKKISHGLHKNPSGENVKEIRWRQRSANLAVSSRGWRFCLLGCRSSTSLAYKGKTLELSPRNLARYAVISPATMLKSLIFLERISWMTSLRPLPNSSGEEPSSGLAPRSTRILSSAKVRNPGSACELHGLLRRTTMNRRRIRSKSSGGIHAIKPQSTHHSNQCSSNADSCKNRHCIRRLTHNDKAGCLD